MNVFLMYPDRDFDVEAAEPDNADALFQDLELSTLIEAMGPDDKFVQSVVRAALLAPLTEPDDVIYRQEILADCRDHTDVVHELHQLTIEAIEAEKQSFHFGHSRASVRVHDSVDVLTAFGDLLRRLHTIANHQSAHFRSRGFTRFFSMVRDELDDDYLATVDYHLKALKFPDGVLISAGLGPGNKGSNPVLRELPAYRRGRFAWLFAQQPETRGFELAARDESGFRALEELRNQGLNAAADAVGQSSDHVLAFFRLLRAELAFYLGCLNLQRTLEQKNIPICCPVPEAARERYHSAQEVYDVGLCLTADRLVVGNDLAADDTDLVFVTGANQGGKSTFLRSIGVARLMMQCGLFVAATTFRANVCSAVFTHYKREEDREMDSGKFEEELLRMSDIVDNVEPNALVLFNESFSATNEREGSEIAGQIVDALLDKHIQVFFVTHFYELAHAFHDPERPRTRFLRADRSADGQRTFKLAPGEPLSTSYGEDLYARIFTASGADTPE